MKKLMLIAAACVALASCVKNEVEPIVNDEPIGFQAVQGLESTRAINYPTSETFIASAYLVEATEDGNVADWDAIGDEKNLKIAYFENKEVEYIDSKWTTNPAYYWPQQGKLTFYAYANSHITGVVDEDTKDLVFENYDVDVNDKDLLVADIEKDKTNLNVGGLVPVVFRHKLTNVQFKIQKQSTTDPREITLKAIELRAMQHKGNYTMPSNYEYPTIEDGWLVDAHTKTYNLFSGTKTVDATPEVETSQEYFMPQELGDNKVLYVEYEIVYNGSKEVVKVAKKLNELDDATGCTADNTWKMNEQVIFTLVVGAPEPIIWKQPVIEDWAVVENITVTI